MKNIERKIINEIKTKCRICGETVKNRSGIDRCRKCYYESLKLSGHPNWKGGKYYTGHGYIKVKSTDIDATKKGYKMQHRVIAEKILGRLLKPSEVIHHINGKEHDNNPKNLYLFNSNKEHMKYHRLSKFNKINIITKSNIY